MVLWTIYVVTYIEELYEFKIDSEKTFGELKRIICEKLNISFNDLILSGKLEYNSKYNSRKLKEIDGLYDQMTLYGVCQVTGGGSWFMKEINIKFIKLSKNII